MKKIFSFVLLGVMSMLMSLSVTAAPLDGLNSIFLSVQTNKNVVKSMVSAPSEAVSVKKSTNSADKALIKTLSTVTMKTSAMHVLSLSGPGDAGDRDGGGIESRQLKQNFKNTRWNKRPLPVT